MFKKTSITAALYLAILLTACGPTYVQPVAVSQVGQYGQYDGNPCDQSYFDAIACQTAINLGGWYLNGILIHHYYGGYGYNYYYNQNRVYIQHGGRVVPYSQAVRVVQSRPQYQNTSSVNSSSKAYIPPSQRSNQGSAGSASRPYTPPSRPQPQSSYSPPSRPSSSYSPPSRRK